MKKSILQQDKECWFCGKQYSLHLHHCFAGHANRKISDKQGFTVYLCAEHHNMGNRCVHNDKEMDLELKRACQKAYEGQGHTREEFINLIGKNFLD